MEMTMRTAHRADAANGEDGGELSAGSGRTRRGREGEEKGRGYNEKHICTGAT
jgi:hypothetical protein